MAERIQGNTQSDGTGTTYYLTCDSSGRLIVNASSDVVSSFTTGGGAAATGTATQIASGASSTATKGVLIKADDDNTGSIYIGHDNTVTANAGASTSGTRLKAGQSLFVPVNNRNLLWLIGSAASQNFTWMVC